MSMFTSIVARTTTVYVSLLALVRIMGKREIGQLSPFDLVVAITMGELAAFALEIESDLIQALFPIGLIAAYELLLSFVSLKSHALRRLITGTPTVVIENGQILYESLRKNRYNVSDLLSQLREKDVFSPSEVEWAILEPSGRLSVMTKSQRRAVTPADLGIDTKYEGLSYPLVCDGEILSWNLQRLRLSEDWLVEQLRKSDIQRVNDVALAMLDTDGQLYISKKRSDRHTPPPGSLVP
jgi:uncharacterized membrane protein YcaP (DUF421 family)